MFSIEVVGTDNFADLPVSARLLYYELGMRADDDGFVASPRMIMRCCGCTGDDLSALLESGYLLRVGEALVIRHWNMNNKIPKSKKSDTAFVDEKAQLETINEIYCFKKAGKSLQSHSQKAAKSLRDDNRKAAQDSIGKNSIDKDSTDTLSAEADAGDSSLYSEVVGLFNNICTSLPKVKLITDKRKAAIRSAGKLLGDASFEELFKRAEASDFLTGRSGKWNACGFDWLLAKSNLTKVLEGNYDNRRAAPRRDYGEKF
jgi:hypothetical protein